MKDVKLQTLFFCRLHSNESVRRRSRALVLNSLNLIDSACGFFQLEEFLPIYSQAKKDKDQGCYEDFLECLKLYDKNENGLMLGAELTHTLLALGKSI